MKVVKGKENIKINAKITLPFGQTPVLIPTQGKFIYVVPKGKPLNKYQETSNGLIIVCE